VSATEEQTVSYRGLQVLVQATGGTGLWVRHQGMAILHAH